MNIISIVYFVFMFFGENYIVVRFWRINKFILLYYIIINLFIFGSYRDRGGYVLWEKCKDN